MLLIVHKYTNKYYLKYLELYIKYLLSIINKFKALELIKSYLES